MCRKQWFNCEIYMNKKGVVRNQQIVVEIELQDYLQRGLSILKQ